MSGLLDEEDLEVLCYERSKAWSNFIKSLADKDVDGTELDIRNFEEIFKNQDEASMVEVGEAIEEKVEDDKAGLQLKLTRDNKDLLDQSLPIVKEHLRKWKEAGLDRILNTFDASKIEHYVGDWLRRNNSLYEDKRYKKLMPVYSTSNSNDSEAESMRSVDTARYIRASRKHTLSTASKCSSPMTKIKMFRTLSRKRSELRAKYGCEEQDHRHHMQSLQLHRRKLERDLKHRTNPRHSPYIILNGRQRRKQYRKRRNTSPAFDSSLSSEDDRDYIRSTNRSYHSHKINYREFHCKRLKLESRSIEHVFEEELHPCRCCSNDRFSSNAVQIVDRSTQTWADKIEGNPDSPQRSKVVSTNSTRIQIKMMKSPNTEAKLICTDKYEELEPSIPCQQNPQIASLSSSANYKRQSLDFIKDLELPNRFGTTPEIISNEEQSDSESSAISKVKRIRKHTSKQILDSESDNSQTDEQINLTISKDSLTRVSSTVDCQSRVSSQRTPFSITSNGILLHKPNQSSTSAEQDSEKSSSNANFTLTEHNLSPIIGQRRARRFLKYQTGSISFNNRLHVYYRPSAKLLAKLSDNAVLTSSSSNESDDDIFEMLARYGVIHSVLEQCSENT